MKFVIMIAASAISASLVVPTVSQGQYERTYQQAKVDSAPAEPASRKA